MVTLGTFNTRRVLNILCVCVGGGTAPQWARASSFTRFLDHTQRRTTVGKTPMDARSACRRDLYLTTHNNHNRQTSVLPVGFEPTISAGERPQTYALDRAATDNYFITPGNYIGDMFRLLNSHLQTYFVNWVGRCYAHTGIPVCAQHLVTQLTK